MLKKAIFLVMISTLIFACSQQQQQTQSADLSVSDITAQAADYVDQSVTLSGTVVHVCRHGGKKMFITGGDADTRFKVTAGPAIGAFDVALEGSEVQVTGIVKVDQVTAMLAESDTEPKMEHQEHDHAEMSDAKAEAADCPTEDGMDLTYSLECSSFQEL